MDTIRVTVNLTPEDCEAVRDMAQESGITRTDVVRRAIATEKFIREAKSKGKKILVESRPGRVRQIVFPI